MNAELFRKHIRLAGISSDGRTNRWSVECPDCAKAFSPLTTMVRTQEIACERCGCQMVANYNDETMKVTEHGQVKRKRTPKS